MMKDKVAVVTGGSRGIGSAICRAFAENGTKLVINYAGNAAAAEETADECRKLGAEAVTVKADVSAPEQCERLIKEAADKFGRIDILVNCAGITRDNLAMRMSEEEYDSVLNTNLKGAFFCMKYASRYMMRQRSGRIISISSAAGLLGNAGQANYSASKAGLIGLTKSMARELASRSITVNAVAPGLIDTDMSAALPEAVIDKLKGAIPLGRTGKADEVAAAVMFLASEGAGYITGQVLSVDGGMAM